MAEFSMPSGGTGDSQRPAASVSNPNPTGAMKSSGKASQSKSTSSLGVVISGIYDTAGVAINQQLPTVKPVDFVPTASGPGGNVASETPDISAANVIGPTSEGETKNKPGRQEPVRGQTGKHASGWVQNVPNPLLVQQPKRK